MEEKRRRSWEEETAKKKAEYDARRKSNEAVVRKPPCEVPGTVTHTSPTVPLQLPRDQLSQAVVPKTPPLQEPVIGYGIHQECLKATKAACKSKKQLVQLHCDLLLGVPQHLLRLSGKSTT